MELRGITWDHERGYNPLIPVTARFCSAHPGATITWTRRSLKDFGDFPVSRLAEKYDLIMVDHPFMAEALQEKILLVLNEYLEPDFLETLERERIGQSLSCYCVDGFYQALPVDAATQVAAANMEFFREKGLPLPRTFQDVLDLKNWLGDFWIGTAMSATDIFSIYLSFIAQQRGKNYFDLRKGIDPAAGEKAAELLYLLASVSHPDSFEMNPIQLLDAMSSDGKIVYTPYLYGYTNYSRDGFRRHPLEFWDAPLLWENAEVSTQMGGVGISVSARIAPEKLRSAVAFAKYLASPEVQKGIYTEADGQPAAKSAWLDEKNNRMTRGFFRNTFKTLETSFVRPKIARWNDFQEEESADLHRQIKEKKSPQEIAEHFNQLYDADCVHQ